MTMSLYLDIMCREDHMASSPQHETSDQESTRNQHGDGLVRYTAIVYWHHMCSPGVGSSLCPHHITLHHLGKRKKERKDRGSLASCNKSTLNHAQVEATPRRWCKGKAGSETSQQRTNKVSAMVFLETPPHISSDFMIIHLPV